MAEEINKLLDEFADNMKQALDYLFDIVQDGELSKPTGMPRWSNKEKREKYQKALKIYRKHFVF